MLALVSISLRPLACFLRIKCQIQKDFIGAGASAESL